jgi:hypothetical protein
LDPLRICWLLLNETLMTQVEQAILAAIKSMEAEHEGFFGVVSFHFQNGVLSLIRREQTTIPNHKGQKKNFDEHNSTSNAQ